MAIENRAAGNSDMQNPLNSTETVWRCEDKQSSANVAFHSGCQRGTGGSVEGVNITEKRRNLLPSTKICNSCEKVASHNPSPIATEVLNSWIYDTRAGLVERDLNRHVSSQLNLKEIQKENILSEPFFAVIRH